jgi:glycosyltransferase involved in cell wall biosynthesis
VDPTAVVNEVSEGVTVVLPARDAARTLARVLAALGDELHAADEVIVVDNGSIDETVELARRASATVIEALPAGSVGRARNRGWDAATRDIVVFLDADAVVLPGWRRGLSVALDEHPNAVIGCARVLVGRNAWSWVAQLQVGTPWLPQGSLRRARSLPSFCLALRRDVPLRFDELFGGEDGVFAADATQLGLELVFDPRFAAVHEEYRDTFADVRRWHRRLAFGMARCGPLQAEGIRKRFLSRFPVHYFVLARLPIMYRRVRWDAELRRRFLRLLPYLVVAEWALGLSALRYVLRRPPMRGSTSTASRATGGSTRSAAPPTGAT